MKKLIYILAATVLLVCGVVSAEDILVTDVTPAEQTEAKLTIANNSNSKMLFTPDNHLLYTHVIWKVPYGEGQDNNNGEFKSVDYTYTLAAEGQTFTPATAANQTIDANQENYEPVVNWTINKNGVYTLTFEATWHYADTSKADLKTKNVVTFTVSDITEGGSTVDPNPQSYTYKGITDVANIKCYEDHVDIPYRVVKIDSNNKETVLTEEEATALSLKVFYAWDGNDAAQKAQALTTPTGTYSCTGLTAGKTYDFYEKFLITEDNNEKQIDEQKIYQCTTKAPYSFKLNVSYETTNTSLTVTCQYVEVDGKTVPEDAEYDLTIGMTGDNIPQQGLSDVNKKQTGNGTFVYEYSNLTPGTGYTIWVNNENRQKVTIDGTVYTVKVDNVYIDGVRATQKDVTLPTETQPAITAQVDAWEEANEVGAFFTDDPTSPRGGKLNFKIKYSNPDNQPVAALRLAAAMAAADAVEGLEYEVWGLGQGAEVSDKIFGLVRIDNPDQLVDADGWINVEMWLSKLPYSDDFKQLYMKSAVVMEDGTVVASNGSGNAGYMYKKSQPVQPTVGYTGEHTFSLDAGNTETSRNGIGELNFDYKVTNPDTEKFTIDKVELYATMESEQIVDFDETKYPLWEGSAEDKPRYIVASRVINGVDITNVNAVAKDNFTLSGLPNDDARVYMRSKITYTYNGETNADGSLVNGESYTEPSGYYDYYILDARSPRTLPMPVRFILNNNYPINISDRSMLAKVEVMNIADIAEADKSNYVADVNFKSLPLHYKYEIRKAGEENWTLIMDHGQQDIIDYIDLEPATDYEAKVTISGFMLYENRNTTFAGSDTFKFKTTANVSNTYRKQENGHVSHPADPVWYPAGAEDIMSSVDNVITYRSDFKPYQTEEGLYYTQKINAVDISKYEDLFYKFKLTGPKRDAEGKIIEDDIVEIWFNTQVKQPQATAWIPLKGEGYDFTKHDDDEEVKITFETNTDFRAGGLVHTDRFEYKIGDTGEVKPGVPAKIDWIIVTPEINRVWSEYDNQITHIQAHLLDENGLILDEESKNIQYEIIDYKTLSEDKVAVKDPEARNHELWGLHFNCDEDDETVKDIIVNAYYEPAAQAGVTNAPQAAAAQHPVGTLQAARNFHYMSAVASGVDEIGAELEVAEPIFFNLQGMKVARPAKGQIYIMVRGDKSSKVMF